MKFTEFCESLKAKIVKSYEEGVTLDEAEKLAGEFLAAQMTISDELKKADLSSRMRKSGVKAVRAAIYMDTATKGDKKPTEAQIAATVDMNDIVQSEQNAFDEAEVSRDEYERIYDICLNAHIYFRGIAKGRFE